MDQFSDDRGWVAYRARDGSGAHVYEVIDGEVGDKVNQGWLLDHGDNRMDWGTPGDAGQCLAYCLICQVASTGVALGIIAEFTDTYIARHHDTSLFLTYDALRAMVAATFTSKFSLAVPDNMWRA